MLHMTQSEKEVNGGGKYCTRKEYSQAIVSKSRNLGTGLQKNALKSAGTVRICNNLWL